jgi:hypothetical protein
MCEHRSFPTGFGFEVVGKDLTQNGGRLEL